MIHHLQTRIVAIAVTFMAALALLTPVSALAQDDGCRCDHITVNVDLGVRCKVTVCVLPINGSRECVTIAPGTRDRLPCIPGATIAFRDCHGNLVPFTATVGTCQLGFGIGPNCCTIDACLDRDDSGCLVINVRPSILDNCPCI